jgi:hypothetical protein
MICPECGFRFLYAAQVTKKFEGGDNFSCPACHAPLIGRSGAMSDRWRFVIVLVFFLLMPYIMAAAEGLEVDTPFILLIIVALVVLFFGLFLWAYERSVYAVSERMADPGPARDQSKSVADPSLASINREAAAAIARLDRRKAGQPRIWITILLMFAVIAFDGYYFWTSRTFDMEMMTLAGYVFFMAISIPMIGLYRYSKTLAIIGSLTLGTVSLGVILWRVLAPVL